MGWSVDVNGTRVVVRVSGRPDDEFDLSAEEARALKNQLHVAYLIARRTHLAAADPEQLSTVTTKDHSVATATIRPRTALNWTWVEE